jgi:hypothetical protein
MIGFLIHFISLAHHATEIGHGENLPMMMDHYFGTLLAAIRALLWVVGEG